MTYFEQRNATSHCFKKGWQAFPNWSQSILIAPPVVNCCVDRSPYWSVSGLQEKMEFKKKKKIFLKRRRLASSASSSSQRFRAIASAPLPLRANRRYRICSPRRDHFLCWEFPLLTCDLIIKVVFHFSLCRLIGVWVFFPFSLNQRVKNTKNWQATLSCFCLECV